MRYRWYVMVGVLAFAFVALPTTVAYATSIFACVNDHSGAVKIVSAGTTCHAGETLISWNVQGATNVQYISAVGSSGSAVRAFCPAGTKVTGGGGLVEGGTNALRQSFPISDTSGTIAFGTTAIGWQVASSDFNGTVMAFVICASP